MLKKHRPGTAGARMIEDILIVTSDKLVEDVKLHLANKKKSYKFMDYGFVVDKHNKLIGAFSIGDLFRYKPEYKIRRLMKRNIVYISPDAKDETAAHLAIKSGVKAIPVVKNGKIQGVLPAKTILKIMHRSSQEDFLHIAGIQKSHLEFEDTMKIPVWQAVSQRVYWLVIGLMGIMGAAGIISAFEEALQKHMILAFFIPAILYLAGALSSQLVTLCVRDLASEGKGMNKLKYLFKQSLIAGILGLIISSITFLTVFIFWGEAYIGFVIAIALLIAAVVTNFTSLVITLMIDKMGKDPAFGSGPFATVVSDVTSIVIYLVVATVLSL
ncbi:MAG: magnesium transporter [Candidatus Woesearchaeota archaeon]